MCWQDTKAVPTALTGALGSKNKLQRLKVPRYCGISRNGIVVDNSCHGTSLAACLYNSEIELRLSLTDRL